MCKRIAWAGVEPVFSEKVAAFCVEDSGVGFAPHKYAKLPTLSHGRGGWLRPRPSIENTQPVDEELFGDAMTEKT